MSDAEIIEQSTKAIEEVAKATGAGIELVQTFGEETIRQFMDFHLALPFHSILT